MCQVWQDSLAALSLLTRLPLAATLTIGPVRRYGLWAFPAIGLLVGGIGGGVLALAHLAGATREIGGLLALTTAMLVTGALHEDGLADFCDGVGGGRTRDRKLEIMRDSRLGTYGALALIIGLAWRWAAIKSFSNISDAILALLLAEAASRAAMLLPLLLPPARRDGLGLGLAGMTPWHVITACWLPATLMIVAYQAGAIMPLLAAGVGGGAITLLAGRYLGGFTGDALGAAQQVSLASILTVLCRMA